MAESARYPWIECRPFHFPGYDTRQIGTRAGTIDDLDVLATLAQMQHADVRGSAGSDIYQMCWSNGYNPHIAYEDLFEDALRSQTKMLYILEDLGGDCEIMAAVVVAREHEKMPRAQSGFNFADKGFNWEFFQKELAVLRDMLDTHEHVHIEYMFINPKYSLLPTTDPENPDPFLAKALFNFVYSQLGEFKTAAAITALVPSSGLWLYEKLGFRILDQAEYTITIPRNAMAKAAETHQQGSSTVVFRFLVWNRRSG